MDRYLPSGFATIAVTALLRLPLRRLRRVSECRGSSRSPKDGLIATPYCEEENIARVARSYGVETSPEEVRRNALKKVYLCQTIGDDSG